MLGHVFGISHASYISGSPLSRIKSFIAVFILSPFFLSLPSLHLYLTHSVCSQGSGFEGYCGMQGPAPGPDQSALQ